jgi:hypothetical protein
VKTVEEHLMFISAHKRDWEERLRILLLACRASTHETTGGMPASMVFRTELCLLCDLLFSAPTDKEQSMTDYMVDLVDRAT